MGMVLLFFLFSMAVIWQLVVIHRQLDHRDGENTLFALAQTQSLGSQLQLEDELLRQRLMQREAFQAREDVFYSRLNLLSDGPQMRALASFGQDRTIQAAIAAFEQAGNAGSLADQPRHSPLHQALQRVIDACGRSANEVMVLQREDRSKELDRLGGLIRAAFVAISVVLITGGLLVWQLMRALSRQRSNLRTIAEQRDTLQQTVHDLEQAQNARETYRNFVALVSHQFRTPLAVIDSTAQRLLRTAGKVDSQSFGDSEMLFEKMNLTRSTVESMSRLIDSVLTSTLMDDKDLRIQQQPVAFAELVGRVVAVNAHLLHERPFSVETASNAATSLCMGDSGLLEQVLQNLISNACKYTDSNTALSIALDRTDDGWLICTVRDWGDGVPEQELSLLFERHFRSEHSRRAKGTGLGLYLSRSIARLHGGDLEASLPAGGGLAVHWRIPVIRTPA